MLLLRDKTGNTRLGLAVGLKFFQMYGYFPQYGDTIPEPKVIHIAKQVDIKVIDTTIPYSITKAQRKEIRDFFGFKVATEKDATELKSWIINIAREESSYAKIKKLAYQYLYERTLCPRTKTPVPGLANCNNRSIHHEFVLQSWILALWSCRRIRWDTGCADNPVS